MVGTNAGTQWLATRGADGWHPRVITPNGAGRQTSYQAFSSDLSTGVLGTSGDSGLAPGTPLGCSILYERDNSTGTYSPLVRTTSTPRSCGRPLYAGSSQDQSKAIFQTQAALTPDAEPATEVPPGRGQQDSFERGGGCMFGCNLYLETEGRLRLVNVLPGAEGHTVPNASFGGYEEGTNAKNALSNVISADGSRVFWTDTQPGPLFGHVFVLEEGSEVQVSGEGVAEYWTASPDGRLAYYTEGGRLWRFDTHSNTREALVGEGSGVLGVVGVNSIGEDGGYVYLVASGVLASNKNSSGASAQAGGDNLYLLHHGEATFIATLSPPDDEAAAYAFGSGSDRYGDWVPNPGDRTAETTPDGRGLVFISVGELTGYDNIGPENVQTPEVFHYSVEYRQLRCVSCNPTGEPPSIRQEPQTPLPVGAESNLYTRRWMSSNGRRIFFDSIQPLTSTDRNGVGDVYEWEEEGEGTCTAGEVSPVNGGCVYLLSGGESQEFSYLVDADASGDNVFFTHLGPLGQNDVSRERNELYDARVGGGFTSASVGCSASECRSVQPLGSEATGPPSVELVGTGNFPPAEQPKKASAREPRAKGPALALRACRRVKQTKKHKRCEQAARRRHRAKHTSRTSNERRVKS
ncbi:MAG TPA: hypothetical protein VGY76_06955 [Solirubrobacteraceae bacterium]|nr:hypothetical protein [Solirubrobacteraceae bacterium]